MAPRESLSHRSQESPILDPRSRIHRAVRESRRRSRPALATRSLKLRMISESAFTAARPPTPKRTPEPAPAPVREAPAGFPAFQIPQDHGGCRRRQRRRPCSTASVPSPSPKSPAKPAAPERDLSAFTFTNPVVCPAGTRRTRAGTRRGSGNTRAPCRRRWSWWNSARKSTRRWKRPDPERIEDIEVPEPTTSELHPRCQKKAVPGRALGQVQGVRATRKGSGSPTKPEDFEEFEPVRNFPPPLPPLRRCGTAQAQARRQSDRLAERTLARLRPARPLRGRNPECLRRRGPRSPALPAEEEVTDS